MTARANKQELIAKVENHEAVCGVVGLGYVGLPLAVEIADAGYKTLGFDAVEKKVQAVKACECYIQDVEPELLGSLVRSGRLDATTDYSRAGECDFVAICVPTPLDRHQQPDTTFMESAAREIAPYLKPGCMVVLESTTYPGTTEDLIRPILEKGSGLACGEDFYLGFSPERVDPGNKKFKTKNTPKVVGAIGSDALESIAALYEHVLTGGVTKVSSPAVAEMEKILENTYRNVNIGLVNELAKLCDRMGISIWEVIGAAKTKPYGFQAFYPGPGLGGHCIPLDPYYLSWKAREYGFHTSMIESSMIVNDSMPEYCCDRAARVLNGFEKSLKGSKVLVLGVSYKQNIDDCRESPALKVLDQLERRGADVSYYDPYVSSCSYEGKSWSSIDELTDEALEGSDLVVITTAHACIDYARVQRLSKAVFDTRNAMSDFVDCDNVWML